MLAFAFYLLKVIICSAVLFGYYWFFLRNKIFHSYNRFYLLAIVVLSLALPVMKVNIWHKASEPQTAVIKMLQVVNSSDEYMDEIVLYSHYNQISKEQLFTIAYMIVCCVFLFMLVQVLLKIRNLLKHNTHKIVEDIHFIQTNAKGTPFSFLQFIFWNDAIDIETRAGRQIFKHEVAHVREKHSYDKLFINIVLIFCWCNPFFWLIRKELNMIHEFIADKKAVEDGDTADFAAMILQATYPQYRFPITNNFFYSPIKRRLQMLTKEQKSTVSYISRLLVLPLAVFVFAAFTIKARTYAAQLKNKPLTVVIDAGHGGTDQGGSALDGTLEKDITLALALKIKELNQSDNIKILLTRSSDIFQTPKEKSDYAKTVGADLLVSIHISSTPFKEKNTRSGLEVFIAGDNFNTSTASKLFASSVIAAFDGNYGLTVSKNPQQREKNIVILQESKCPAVLIEAGYLSNDKDLAYLRTGKAVETFANNVLNAIKNYASTKPEANDLLGKAISDTTPKQLPLYILDGKEISADETKLILPSTIESVNVINATNALIKYGTKGKYGAVEMILKKTTDPDYKPVLSKISQDIYVNAYQYSDKATHKSIEHLLNENISSSTIRPLIILNGKEVPGLKGYNVSMENISDIRILKPETAMPTYGEKAQNGVIIVNTKANPLPKGALIILDNKMYEGKALQEVMATNDFREIDRIEIFDKEQAIEKYGAKGKNGAVIIISKKSTQGPAIIIPGINGHKVHIDQLKNIKEVRSSLSEYTIIGATVYFSGAGFPHVVSANLLGESLESLRGSLDKVVAGTVITFDNVLVKTADGNKMTIKGASFDFYDKDEDLVTVFNHDIIFDKVETEPDFPGGKDAWKDYLIKNLDAGMPVDEGWKAGTYKIMVQFIVDKDGNVSDVKTNDFPNSKTAKQCIDLIKNGPKWMPAKQNGKIVKAYKKQPITFVVSEN